MNKKLAILGISITLNTYIYALDPQTQEALNNAFEIQKEVEKRELSGESPFNSGKLTMENKDSYVGNNISVSQSYQNPHYQNQAYAQGYPQEEISEEQILLMKQALRNKNLRAIQQKFLNKKYTGFENTLTIPYEENKTQKIRTRFTMATTLMFDADIASYILGDQSGFRVDEIPNLNNALSIKPLLIGIDTNLTIFTKDNKIHNFYLYSTDYKSKENPNLLVKITDDESLEIVKELREKEEKEFLIIKEGIAKIKVKRSEIDNNYKQKAKRENEWLLAEEIFSDDTFTYFKYDKKKNNKIPTIFAVIDKKDTPVETKVIGNYIIAETRNPKWTIWSGDSYVCVEKIQQNTTKESTYTLPNKVETRTIKQ
ncbi:type IV secretion system protein VirB9 [Helicobacter sp. MIT 11-5569]|uniref:TrbG/VirB9 family P-type conjugative transfer protein n=1 Tax=Helicobacter sp. MIT 11-5569 TaxID=1548151 RepID=UPI0009E0A1A9|nr:TrbG/VirB9 family P-type conjugative transfer protein [Helicobacter sp. MIT 11-5569]TLD85191.1 type IV secretion system protein VirB9 [Helicobacter sp. MIT 11-5569]